jgi:hypothetical protein
MARALASASSALILKLSLSQVGLLLEGHQVALLLEQNLTVNIGCQNSLEN